MKIYLTIILLVFFTVPSFALDSLEVDSLLKLHALEIDSTHKKVKVIYEMKKEIDVYLKNIDVLSNAISTKSDTIGILSNILSVIAGILILVMGYGAYNQNEIRKKLEEIEKLKSEAEASKAKLKSAGDFFEHIKKQEEEVEKGIKLPTMIHNPSKKEKEAIITALDKIRLIKASGHTLSDKANLFVALNHFYKKEYHPIKNISLGVEEKTIQFSEEMSFLIGVSHYHEKEYQSADKYFQNVLKINPENALAYHYLIETKKFYLADELINPLVDNMEKYDTIQLKTEHLIRLVKQSEISEDFQEYHAVIDVIPKLRAKHQNNRLLSVLKKEAEAQKEYKIHILKEQEYDSKKQEKRDEIDKLADKKNLKDNKEKLLTKFTADYYKMLSRLKDLQNDNLDTDDLIEEMKNLAEQTDILADEINELNEIIEQLNEVIKNLNIEVDSLAHQKAQAIDAWKVKTEEAIKAGVELKSWMDFSKQIYKEYIKLPDSINLFDYDYNQ